MEPCLLCPRDCGVDRSRSFGYCRANTLPTVAKIMLHLWEEPCICYGNGSGAIFFSSCQLRCIYCQNHAISRAPVGRAMDSDDLYRSFFELRDKGACNINLVSPTPHLEVIIPAIEKAKKDGLDIPIVFNSGGYEKAETLKRLNGLIDVYLLDFKYFSEPLSSRLSAADDYRERCIESLKEAIIQCGNPVFNGDRLLSGVIVRHLILPGSADDSANILNELKNMGCTDQIVLSLMRQYTPTVEVKHFSPLNRKLTSLEYSKVVSLAEKYDFKYLYTQKKESASEDFIPDFSVDN